MDNANIHINSPLNGVFLPNANRAWQTNPFPNATPHLGGHTNQYKEMVNEILKDAVAGKTPGTKEYKAAVVNALTKIRVKLLIDGSPL